MAAPRHIFETYIQASPERIWEAITDPTFTRQYLLDAGVESSFEPGEAIRYVGATGEAAVGEIEIAEPPCRLVLSFRLVYDAALAEEPPSRVEWLLTPAGEVTRVTLLHGDLGFSPLTWQATRRGWVRVLGGLKTLLETGAPLAAIVDEDESVADADEIQSTWHRAQGVEANNATWQWLGKPDGERSADDEAAMTRSAYAAAYHWARAAGRGPENEARAEWLLARVWTVRRHGELALAHADRCLAICQESGLADFDLAYAHEGRARALAALGRLAEAAAARELAAAVPIADDEDREIVERDLAGGPWFGLEVRGAPL